jgi:hypothetical protein
MSRYCVISEFFRQLDEMENLVGQVENEELRAQLMIVHTHMHRIVRIGERAALDLEAGLSSKCVVIPRSELERREDTW